MVGCLHIPEFSAWARQLQSPSLRAIAVYHGGRIVARSRYLCQAGMLLGDPVGRARALFPKASFFRQDTQHEHDVWEHVLARINMSTPRVESVSLGTAFFKPYKQSETSELARSLAVQLGVGPNRNISRIAAVRSAPRSVLLIRRGTVDRFLASTVTPVLHRLGFDDDLVARLALYGLTNLALVRSLTRQHLSVQFGEPGVALFNLLHPAPSEPPVSLYTPPAVIHETTELDFHGADFSQTSALLSAMVCRAVSRLGTLCCRSIRVQLKLSRTNESPLFVIRSLKKPSSDPAVIARAADYLLHQLLATPFEISALEVTLCGLENPVSTQAGLFFERPPLHAAIADLEERFPGMILGASVVCPAAPFPENQVRLSPFSKRLLA